MLVLDLSNSCGGQGIAFRGGCSRSEFWYLSEVYQVYCFPEVFWVGTIAFPSLDVGLVCSARS